MDGWPHEECLFRAERMHNLEAEATKRDCMTAEEMAHFRKFPTRFIPGRIRHPHVDWRNNARKAWQKLVILNPKSKVYHRHSARRELYRQCKSS